MWGCEAAAAANAGGGAPRHRAAPADHRRAAAADCGAGNESRGPGGATAAELAELLPAALDGSADRRAPPGPTALGAPAGRAARARGPRSGPGAGGAGGSREADAPHALPRVRRRPAGHRSSPPPPAGHGTPGRAADDHRVPVVHAYLPTVRDGDAGPRPPGVPAGAFGPRVTRCARGSTT